MKAIGVVAEHLAVILWSIPKPKHTLGRVERMTSTRVSNVYGDNCEKCVMRVRRASVTQYWSIGDSVFRMRLCADHQKRFLTAMGEWILASTVVDNEAPQPKEVRSNFSDEDTRRIREIQENARRKLPAKTVLAESTSRPSSPDEWRYRVHSQQREFERGFSHEKVLAAAADPETTYPEHRRGPNYRCHMREGCYVVVDIRRKEIITVMDELMFRLDREKYQNASKSA